jgi:DNA-binding transcriptional MerR regulator
VRIRALAERTGVTEKALRYYERLGALTPVRAENGYRAYRDADIRVVDMRARPNDKRRSRASCPST